VKHRRLHPEQLDQLPGRAPTAIAAHRDLRRINRWMGNTHFIRQPLRAALHRSAPQRIVDLGAGDGAFLLRCLQGRIGLPKGTELLLLDRRDAIDPAVLARLDQLGFHPRPWTTDALDWLRNAPVQPGTWILANLFLHHLDTESLRHLFRLVARHATWFGACEPRRDWISLAGTRLLPLIGAHAVTRHDAPVSVRAGFRGRELSPLWPEHEGWRLRESRAGLFSHRFVAEQNPPP
jgi:hypothetical protein